MHAVLAWSALALLAGPLAPQGQRKWKPLFDYTNPPPSNTELWAPLGSAKVSMEEALKVAGASEEKPVHPYKAELDVRDGTAVWRLELFVGEMDADKPGRLNLQVSTSEPKVLKRVELLTLAPDEERTWQVFRKSKVPLENALEIAKDKVVGQKGEKMIVPDPRVRTAHFVPEGAPIWEIDVMGIEDKNDVTRRYMVHVGTDKPLAKQKIMQDRFVGEPLRSAEAVQLPNGMFLHDFKEGDGPEVKPDSKVRVNYRLFLLDSTKIHDTWETKQEETFLVSQAPLKGISEGLVGMRAGGRRKIAMPYTMAFGETGNELAPRKAMVVCDISVEELITK